MKKTIIVPASTTDTTVTIDIPDPVYTQAAPTVAAPVITQAAPVITMTGGTPPPVVVDPPPADQVYNYNMQSADYARPAAGAKQFYGGNGSQVPLPFSYFDNDQRFLWKEIQTGPTSYNWGNLDAAINKCISSGQRLNFRITTCDSGQMAFPSFVPALASNQPDFNSETYLSAYEKFVAAMADHLKNTDSVKKGIKLIAGIFKIDIGGIGNWNEMHWSSLTVPVITAANGKRMINAYTTNFPDTWLSITISALTSNSSLGAELARALLDAKNNLGPVAIRCDHLGWLDTFKYDMDKTKYYSSDVLDIVLNRWKTSPIDGELMNNLNGINPASPYSDLLYEVGALHISQFSNNSWCRNSASKATAAQISASDANILAASKAAGARIGITSAMMKSGQLVLTWQNFGNAPVYENWLVNLTVNGVKQKATNILKGLLPGTQMTAETILQAGPISIQITDPLGVRPPFPLMNTGRQGDGSYILIN